MRALKAVDDAPLAADGLEAYGAIGAVLPSSVGHPVTESVLSAPTLFSGVNPPAPRVIPDDFTEDDRSTFSEIAARCRVETAHDYTTLAIGLKLFHSCSKQMRNLQQRAI